MGIWKQVPILFEHISYTSVKAGMDKFYEILREGQGYGVEIMFDPFLGVRFVGPRSAEWNWRLAGVINDNDFELVTWESLADNEIRVSRFESEKWNEQS